MNNEESCYLNDITTYSCMPTKERERVIQFKLTYFLLFLLKNKVYLKDLVLDDHARKKLIELVEDRYDPETDELTIVADRYSIFIVIRLLKALASLCSLNWQ